MLVKEWNWYGVYIVLWGIDNKFKKFMIYDVVISVLKGKNKV